MESPDSGEVQKPTKRLRTASARVMDKANDAEPELSSHRAARNNASTHTSEAHSNASSSTTKANKNSSNHSAPSRRASSTKTSHSSKRKSPDRDVSLPAMAGGMSSQNKDAPAAGTEAGPSKRQRQNTPSDTSADSDSGKDQIHKTLKDRSRDVDAFFELPEKGHDGKPRRKCKLCSRKRVGKPIVNEVTTLRRHIESAHEGAYNKWARENNFESKLPKAVHARKDAQEQTDQQTLDDHVSREAPSAKVVPYSDALFRDAAIQWLIETNQLIQALEHPSFKNMIDIAARSTRGVVIPGRKATRAQIVKLFKQNLTNLRNRINNNKTGLVSLTCDAWQAGNQDAYFAVTGHWNEEISPNNWENQSALFGFTQMNTAHDGLRLGRALYKIIQRIGIEDKVSWITCDNASNNLTMLEEFAKQLNKSSKRQGRKYWDAKTNHIRCLAHVINLATQALISGYSNTKFFDPEKPNDHDPDVNATDRDVVGLVRAVTVKVRSSAKRKEKFKKLQRETIKIPKTLLLDMKVRWSSTYIMLQRAFDLKSFVDDFVYELGREETDHRARARIDALKLNSDEWKRVENFIDLLKFADKSQQAFSYENRPCLYSGIPALESLHKAWYSRAFRPKYAPFANGLLAGAEKVEEYYNKTATSHAYTFVMLLDPDIKMGYFEKNWDKELQSAVLLSAETIFKERYSELYKTSAEEPTQKGKQKRSTLYDDDSEDGNSDDNTQHPKNVATPLSDEPWRAEFNRYIRGEDELPEKTTLIQWWGMNARRLPVWASLALDYLAIMASSVSSERAFSSAEITISKRRNRLKGDIVEVLEFLKSMYIRDLIYREPGPTSILEEDLEVIDDDGDSAWVDEGEADSWDSLIIDYETDSD